MAHWLSWRCGLGLHAAREQVRVARALRNLPQVREAFGRGALSYSKVRALSRIATATGEGALVEFARVATAAQVERTVAAYAGVRRNVDPDRARLQHDQRTVRVLHNDDGTVTITARLAPDAAVTVLAALEHAQRQVVREAKDVPAGTSRADALELVARAYVQPDAHARAATQLVIHTDANVTVGVDDAHRVAMPLDALRRLACDAIVRRVRDDEDGRCDDQGRRRYRPSRALRRRLVRRDGDMCRWRGCGARHYLHIHHIAHWIDGGATDAENLLLLCSHHHRLVHDGHWTITGNANRQVMFHAPDGRVLDEQPHRALHADWRTVRDRYHRITGSSIATATGERLDLHWTISALCCLIPPDRN